MAQCTECGARNAEQATFCVRCGAQLRATAVPEDAPGQNTDRIDPVEGEILIDEEPGYTRVMEPSAAEAVPVPEAERLLRDASAKLSRGDADGAAMACREAITLAPDLVAAYSLLGMAEEQRGNTVAAAGAYRRVLQLDPGRSVEREKLEALYETGGASRPEGEDFDSLEDAPALRFAPWIAAAAAAFLVLMVLTALGLRVHSARVAERIYTEQMQVAEQAMAVGDYSAAVAALQTALRVRPGDEDADRLLRWAQRRSATAQGPAGYYDIPQQPSLAEVLPSSGPNPFLPVPIGGDTPPAEGVEQPQGRALPPSQGRATPPPVVSTERVVGGQQATGGSTGPVPFGPLDDPGDQAAPPTEPAAQEPRSTEPAPEPRPQGQITIWMSDEPAPASRQQPPAAATSTRSASASQAAQLRQQADQARTGGNCDRASELYGAAIEAYRADTAANPGNRQANEAAIQACERARSLCEAAEGQ